MRLAEYYVLKKIDEEIKELRIKQDEIYNLVINNALDIKENKERISSIIMEKRKIGFEK